MRKLETADDVEKALDRLMPVGLSARACGEIENMIGGLAASATSAKSHGKRRIPRGLATALGGIAVALAGGFGLILTGADRSAPHDAGAPDAAPLDGGTGMVCLTEADHIKEVRDEGLFVDAGGSAVRRLRVNVVEESRLRDARTGIVMKLTEPREETYSVPVTVF